MKTNQNTTTKSKHFLLIALTKMLCLILFYQTTTAQSCVPNIGDFISVNPNSRGQILKLPPTHTFQKIIQSREKFSNGEFFVFATDFAGYVPINNSSTNGYLSINDESTFGQVAVLDINYKENDKLWSVTQAVNLNFVPFGGTSRNCSGAVTPWGTVISSEETTTSEIGSNGYKKFGWQVEIDPVSKTVLGKRYAMGNFEHENAAIRQYNGKTVVYQGADRGTGYLYKFVSFQENDLSNGDLYVYKGTKGMGIGSWIKIINQSIADRNNTLQLSANAGGTVFNAVEDVEIGPNGLVYFAVKNEKQVYYFEDTNPLGTGIVSFKGTYVGGDRSYPITLNNGTTVSEPWGTGNDNLAFDNDGNLWILQDGSEDHIWLVKNGHTQTNPKVEVFATTPTGSEPTGITFSPDNRFMFISIQHPGNNQQTITDAAGDVIKFDQDITLVIARNEHLGNNSAVLGCMDNAACNYNTLATIEDCSCTYPIPNFDCNGNCLLTLDCQNTCGGQALAGTSCNDGNSETINDVYDANCVCQGELVCPAKVVIGANESLQTLYESSQSIETAVTNSPGVDVLIEANEVVNLKSNHIKLFEGFKVENGACLNATIAPCE